MIGFTSRLNTINAAIGLVQLKRLDAWNGRRRAIARMYDPRLQGLPGIALPPGEDADKRPVYHCYAVLTEGREGLSRHLAERGIATAVHYPIPIHRQAAYAEKGGGRHGGPFFLIALTMFVCTASYGKYSQVGTCLRAAALKTTSMPCMALATE